MKTVLYLFAFAAVLAATSCSSRPDSPQATQGATAVKEDTAADRTQVEAPVAPVNDRPVSADSTMGP